jgi:hypothetical protein
MGFVSCAVIDDACTTSVWPYLVSVMLHDPFVSFNMEPWNRIHLNMHLADATHLMLGFADSPTLRAMQGREA